MQNYTGTNSLNKIPVEQSFTTAPISTASPSVSIKTESMSTEAITAPPILDAPTQLLFQKTVASSNHSHSLDDASEMSTDSTETKKKKEYGETVSRSYIILAEAKGWKNSDNSIFPISMENLCNYIRAKMATNNSKSIEWYLNGLRRYHEKLFKNKDWELVCKHPDVTNLLKQIKAEKESSLGTPHPAEKGNWRAEQINAENRFTEVSTNVRVPVVIEATQPNNSISAEPNLEFLGTIPFLDVASGNNETFSNLLDDDSYEGNDETDSQEESSGSKSVLTEKFDPMIVGSDSDEDDEDYVPPKMRRRYQDVQYIQETLFADDEPESFKSRYENAYSNLKMKYTVKCDFHPEGCVQLGEGRHFILTERLYKRWAALVASGEDFDADSLPNSSELDEFHTDRAISM
ncbi:10042_t:CDS:2 [Acaulospora morrowiae]|uniref:10042_t:CDS:1 n=1 Tax=Acaulospora morrowiae TaxID=94023 RepID=A0A9N9B342_9GLOM|nr:10042_t:CDS:2 [Acaulospora morrowiae]